MSQETVGFIGLGNMGGAIVRRLLATHVPVLAYDVNPEVAARFEAAGATIAKSARDVADRTALVIACLPTGGRPDVAGEAAQGAAIEVYAELSTMSPARCREIERIVAAHDVALIDAPVSGGVTIAERGELSLMMAGAPAPMERLAAALATVTSHVFRIGSAPGQAQLCKLVNNAIGFTVFVASCEALTVGAAGGIRPTLLLDAVNAGSGRNSWTTDKFAPHVLSRTFDAGGKLGGGPPALDLYLEEAARLGMPPGLVARTRALWAHIAEQFDPRLDFTNMVRYFESFTGVELRADSVAE